jgi:hypothetical protein
VNTNGEDIIYSILKGSVVRGGIDCGGMAIDKFHNLFFVDMANSRIKKVNLDLLELEKYPADVILTIY